MAFPDPERFTFVDIATRWGKSLNYVHEYARTGTLKVSGRIQPRTRPSDSMAKQFPPFKIVSYVKREDLYAFEERFGIHVSQPRSHVPSKGPFLSEDLRIANEVYVALYISNPDVGKRGHKERIRGWIKQHYPDLSAEAVKRITTLVNPNKKGGAPKL